MLSADLSKYTDIAPFAEKFPSRFFQVGMAEQNMMGIAGGLAGTRSARHLAERRGALNIVFAVVIIAVALYMLARNISLSPA